MNIAVFYHCKVSGDGIPDESYAMQVACGQMDALKRSGLEDAAQEIYVGVNGSDADAVLVSSIIPQKASLTVHGKNARSEIPTQMIIQEWVKSHPDWYVLYHHTKGVTHPGQELYDRWRNRMEHMCVWQWRECINDLKSGFDACGCHWLTPEKFPAAVTSPFFGGTFWWAHSNYLRQLPPLPAATWDNRFEAESWIGRRRPYPMVRDYIPGWP